MLQDNVIIIMRMHEGEDCVPASPPVNNFKRTDLAVLPLSSVTVPAGASASGTDNALKAVRILNRLAQDMRLDDIGHRLHRADAHIRGRAADRFQDVTAPLTPGPRPDGPGPMWNE